MSQRTDWEDELVAVAERNLKKAEETKDPHNSAWLASWAATQQNKAIISMLGNISKRLELIETALGLMAAKKED